MKAQGKQIEVTSLETGKTFVLTRKAFFRTFGKIEGQNILDGYAPHIVAIELIENIG